MARCAFHTQPNCDTTCFCNEGWICEAHPDQGWPHDDCAGPGEPCPRCNTDDRRDYQRTGSRSSKLSDASIDQREDKHVRHA
jgi:hypothetical protein